MKTELPSRRYTCAGCGGKGRRNNSPSQRMRDHICPRCERNLSEIEKLTAIAEHNPVVRGLLQATGWIKETK